MSTPSLQTFVTDASQVLNLSSISAVRSVVAVALANANAGTPLNPNLTTQQLWNEFYQVVTEPKSNIESFIANQMMKFFFSPPAPGGAGADKQVIFNDGGVLAGDTKFLWDKNANRLDVDGPVVITGALTVATNVLVAHAAGYTGKVGIGTATPGETLDVKGTGNFNNTSGTYLGFQTNAAQVGYIGTANTIITGGLNTELGLYANSSLVIATGASALQRLRVETAGDVTISTGNVVMATSGKGIDFGATSSPSAPSIMTSELLNDYEEGTWTIGLAFGGASTGITTGSNTGNYTKVGRLVTVFGYIDLSSKGSSTGSAAITGLPFAVGAASSNYSAASLHLANITFADFPMGFGNTTTTTILLQEITNAGVRTSLTDADFANNSSMIFSLTYSV